MIKIKTASVTEPVSGADVRTYLRMDSSAYDTTLDMFATAARTLAEDYTRRSFTSQTWYMMLDENAVIDSIALARPPLQSVSSVKVYNDAGTLSAAISNTYYTVDTYNDPGWILLNSGYAWPYMREYNGMLIEFVTGYGLNASDVPAAIRMAITETAANWYNDDRSEGRLPKSMSDVDGRNGAPHDRQSPACCMQKKM